LAVLVFHPFKGRWGPACLRVATASVETVSPPLLYFSTFLREELGVHRGESKVMENERNDAGKPRRKAEEPSDTLLPIE
jgi:hypothetical protein